MYSVLKSSSLLRNYLARKVAATHGIRQKLRGMPSASVIAIVASQQRRGRWAPACVSPLLGIGLLSMLGRRWDWQKFRTGVVLSGLAALRYGLLETLWA